MENLFYAPPENFVAQQNVEIDGQEAKHISRVLRHQVGDQLDVADGRGTVYRCKITNITKKSVFADIQSFESVSAPGVQKVMAFGAIKKRDRLEFAVEKAVELGVWEICIFNADHSERSKINEERMHSIVVSAFKQSKRKWLPELKYFKSLDQVFEKYTGHTPILAHVDEEVRIPEVLQDDKYLLLTGPEGGFSEREEKLAKEHGAKLISLGPNRLRAETAVAAMLSQYLFTK